MNPTIKYIQSPDEPAALTLKACPPLEQRTNLPMMKSHRRLRSYGEFVYKPLGRDMWTSFMCSDTGRFLHEDAVRKTIYLRGVHSNIRREVWKYLLGYFAFDSTFKERVSLEESYSEEYKQKKETWEDTLKQIQNEGSLEHTDHWHPEQSFKDKVRNLMGCIQKDIVRTDRRLTFYEGADNKNVQALGNILLTYTTAFDSENGYVQGMSDLTGPQYLL